MNQLDYMVDDEIHILRLFPLPKDAILTYFQSGYIQGGFVSSLGDCGIVNGTVVREHNTNTVLWNRGYLGFYGSTQTRERSGVSSSSVPVMMVTRTLYGYLKYCFRFQ